MFLRIVGIDCLYWKFQNRYVVFLCVYEHIHLIFKSVARDRQKLFCKLYGKTAKSRLGICEVESVKKTENPTSIRIPDSASFGNVWQIKISCSKNECIRMLKLSFCNTQNITSIVLSVAICSYASIDLVICIRTILKGLL